MGHVALQVDDLQKNVAFYRDVLGLKPAWVGDDDWANLELGSDDLSLVKRGGAVHPPHFGFRTESPADLLEWHRHLMEKGVFVEPISTHRDGSQSFYFKDPDGNVLEALWDPRFS